MLQSRNVWGIGVDGELLPHLVFVLKDKAYACRRLTSRGWARDDALREVAQRFMLNRRSPVQMIRNRLPFRAVFSGLVKASETAGGAEIQLSHPEGRVDLRSAKHRFESHQKLFGEAVLEFWLPARTAVRAMRGRRGREEGHWAQSALILSMMADAGGETHFLVQRLDSEDSDPAKLAGWVRDYLGRLRALYFNGICANSRYTKVMLKCLADGGRRVFVIDGQPQQIGAPRVGATAET
eukprot:6526417-Pyramimonas_sp.AAC.1